MDDGGPPGVDEAVDEMPPPHNDVGLRLGN